LLIFSYKTRSGAHSLLNFGAQMRTVYFFISLFFLLLGSGADAHAMMQHKRAHNASGHNVTRNHHVKFTGKNIDSTVIEDTDLDLDEECSSVSNIKDGNANKFFIEKYGLPQAQYGLLAYRNTYFTQFKNFPAACGHSSPIYIVHRVLRI